MYTLQKVIFESPNKDSRLAIKILLLLVTC